MMNNDEIQAILDNAEELHSAEQVQDALKKIAAEINEKLSGTHPLLLSVMGGAVVFTGQLLPLLDFPLDFDYIHVSRYGNKTNGGEIEWKVAPKSNVAGRAVLVVDDILDEGETMADIRDKVLALGAASFHCAVFADKKINKPKPIAPDFVAMEMENRFVFGFGMDIHGAWRNLPAIYAVKEK